MGILQWIEQRIRFGPPPSQPRWPVPEITLEDRQREILNEGGAELGALSNIASGYGEAVHRLHRSGKLTLEIKRGAYPDEDRYIYRLANPSETNPTPHGV